MIKPALTVSCFVQDAVLQNSIGQGSRAAIPVVGAGSGTDVTDVGEPAASKHLSALGRSIKEKLTDIVLDERGGVQALQTARERTA